MTARIPPSLNTHPQCLITPKGSAPVISFIVSGQMKGDRAVTSNSRLVVGVVPEVVEEEPGGEEAP